MRASGVHAVRQLTKVGRGLRERSRVPEPASQCTVGRTNYLLKTLQFKRICPTQACTKPAFDGSLEPRTPCSGCAALPLGSFYTLTLALTTSRPANHACLHRGEPLIWILLPVELFDLSRLEENHGAAAAAVLAPAAPPPVLADAAAAAVLAPVALPPVLADAAAAAVLAVAALPPVLAEAAAAAVLAPAAPPPVLADAAAAAVLAVAALLPVLADAAAAAVLAQGAPPPVLADATTAAVLAVAAPPPVLADAAAAALLAPAALPPVLALLPGHFPPQRRLGLGPGPRRAVLATDR